MSYFYHAHRGNTSPVYAMPIRRKICHIVKILLQTLLIAVVWLVICFGMGYLESLI